MVNSQRDNFYLGFLQEVLPVGLAMVDRFNKDGVKKTVDGFISSDLLVEELRAEGEQAAQIFRDRLDKVSPGLGNPVMAVEVEVEEVEEDTIHGKEIKDQKSLVEVLNRIQSRMDSLENFLLTKSEDKSIEF